MKKNLFYMLLVLAPLLFLCYCHMANRPVSTPSSTSCQELASDHIEPSSSTPPSLKLYASGACLMDTASGRILYGKEESSPLPMASTTKIMTCILALENGDPQDPVTFSKKAASMPKVHLGAGSGKTFSLKDLLYSLMLESHNDTAVAIAEHIGGSVEGFAAMMNAKAGELGMTRTNFVTPNGLDADGHSSTPEDMCRLASYACQNKEFLEIIGTPSRTIRDSTGKCSYSLTNHDAFLTSYNGAIGIKTGFTGKAGYCFVGAATRGDLTLASCVLASGWPPNKSYKWADTKTLMDFGFKHFSKRKIPIKDLSSFHIKVNEGKSDSTGVISPDIPHCLLSSFDTIDVEYNIPTQLNAPIRKDIPIGTITLYINSVPAGNYEVYPDSNIEKMDFSDLLYYTLRLFFSF